MTAKKTKKRRATLSTDRMITLDESRVRLIVKETFQSRSVDCDVPSLQSDLNRALRTVTRSYAERLRIVQQMIIDLPPSKKSKDWDTVIWEAGTDHFIRAKAKGIDECHREIGALEFHHVAGAITAKIKEFFQLVDLFRGWCEEASMNGGLWDVEPESLDTLITCFLPDIFKTHFPNEFQGPLASATTRFIASVLTSARIYPADKSTGPNDVIAKRFGRKHASCRRVIEARRPYTSVVRF